MFKILAVVRGAKMPALRFLEKRQNFVIAGLLELFVSLSHAEKKLGSLKAHDDIGQPLKIFAGFL